MANEVRRAGRRRAASHEERLANIERHVRDMERKLDSIASGAAKKVMRASQNVEEEPPDAVGHRPELQGFILMAMPAHLAGTGCK